MSMELPLNPQWGNFGTVIDQGKLVEAFFNSVLYSFGGTVLSVLVSAFAAYVLARHRTQTARDHLHAPDHGDRDPDQLRDPDEGDAGDRPDRLADRDHPAVRGHANPVQRLPDLRLHRHAAQGARRGGIHRRLLAAPDLRLDHPSAADAGAGDLRRPEPAQPLERVPDAAVLPEQHAQLADDPRRLQLLRPVPVELGPGLGRRRSDDPAHDPRLSCSRSDGSCPASPREP